MSEGQPDNPPSTTSERLVDQFLKAIGALRRHLGLSEAAFRGGPYLVAARPFVIYGVLDELEKAAIALMKLKEFLSEGLDSGTMNDDSVFRTTLTSTLEEVRLRIRRLCEAFVHVVLFQTTNEEQFYRHYILLCEADRFLSFTSDLQEFHGKPSRWVAMSMRVSVQDLVPIEKSIDLARAWYRNAKLKGPLTALPKPGSPLLSSLRAKIKLAMGHLTPAERVALGGTYSEAYGRPSASIHFGMQGRPEEASGEVVLAEAARIRLLMLHLIARVHQLLGDPAVETSRQLARVAAGPLEGVALFETVYIRSKIQVGDFVVVAGMLGEVTELGSSDYGYTSFKVSFLAERPFPEIDSDWFPARMVRLMFSLRDVATKVHARVGDRTPLPGDLTSYREAMRESVLDAWKLGLREHVNRRPDNKG